MAQGGHGPERNGADQQGAGRIAGDPGNLIIDDRFRIVPAAQLADFGGVSCFRAEDRRRLAGDVVALRTSAAAPPRPKLSAFTQAHHDSLISPLAHGAAGAAYWIICPAPSGPPLSALATPWSGNALLTHVLRPLSRALDQLQISGLTHRAIRPDNVFMAAGGRSVVLGPACAAPPAMHQAAIFEPPYSALCAPSARGDGTIADDVYALGVLLLALWTGEMPLAGMAEHEIIRLKLERGSHAALTSKVRLQRGFDEILRAMLSDDPLARPHPEALGNLDGIHARRGGQRPALRVTRPIAIGAQVAWNRPMLALLCAERPAEAMELLREGVIEQWARSTAEETALAAGLEALRRDDMFDESWGPTRRGGGHGGAVNDFSLLRLIALLDPLAPLFWRGRWLWPDGLGPFLAAALAQPAIANPSDMAALVDSLVARSVMGRWRLLRSGRPDPPVPVVPAELLQRSHGDDEQAILFRIAYLLNPFLPCASPRLANMLAMTPVGLLALLERLAEPAGSKPLLDPHMLAFLRTHLEEQVPDNRAGSVSDPDETTHELRLLARCQVLAACGPLRRIAAALLPRLETMMQDWPGVSRREKRIARLRDLAAGGDLTSILKLLHDAEARQQDEAARRSAADKIADIAAFLAEQAETMPLRLELSRAAARDTAYAAGVLSIMASLLFELLS